MSDRLTILDAMDDPKLFGPAFPGDSWGAWRAFLRALFGLPMGEADLRLYREHTGRETPPETAAMEAYGIVGRRGGKSRVAAAIAVFLAAFRDYSGILAPGEMGTVPVIAADRKQARVVMGYVRGLLDGSDLLSARVRRRLRERIELTNRVAIEIHTASFRTTRGYTVVAAVLDELAFWRSEESAEPDLEIIRALRPAMATVPGAMLVGISTAYSRRGALWQAFRDHYGKDGPLVWRAPTLTMNPTVDRAVIDRAYREDAVAAAAEYGSEFRSDLESYVTAEVLDAVTSDRGDVPAVANVEYVAFTDPSGGASDSFTLAIAHAEKRETGVVVVVDAVRERRPPFSPDGVVADYSELMRRGYRVRQVTGDRYAGEWPRERFRVHGIEYRVAEKVKSDLYRDLLPALTGKRVDLPSNRVLAAQLTALERRVAAGGRETIAHPPGGRDDVANAVAGAVVAALRRAAVPVELPENALVVNEDLEEPGLGAGLGTVSSPIVPGRVSDSRVDRWGGRRQRPKGDGVWDIEV